MNAAKKKAGTRTVAKKSAAKERATSAKKKATGAKKVASASDLIDGRITDLGDWREETLATIRSVIDDAIPQVIEEWKWRGVPVWSHNGIVCTGESYKDKVKVTFAKGASLNDANGLFNASLDGGTRRAIDFFEGARCRLPRVDLWCGLHLHIMHEPRPLTRPGLDLTHH